MPGGETTDALVVWLPDSRTVLTGNLFGPLFGHVPNLVTIRGDRYRDALAYVDSLAACNSWAPSRLFTGHFDPIVGGATASPRKSTPWGRPWHWVHDGTVEG